MPRTVAVSFFVNEEYSTTEAVPRETSLEELRQRWRDASQHSGPACFLLESLSGAVLPEEGCLQDIVPPERSSLAIHVLRGDEKNLRIFGSSLDPLRIRLLPRETVAGLMERAKRLLGIEEGRAARLLCEGRALDAAVPPSVQVAGAAFVDLDLEMRFEAADVQATGFHPALFEQQQAVVSADLPREAVGSTDPLAPPAFVKGDQVRPLRLFASQPARELFGAGEWRAIAWGSAKVVSSDQPVCDLVTEECLLSGAVCGVVLERRIQVRLEEKLRQASSEVAVWPSDQLDILLTNVGDVLLFEGQPLDSTQSFWKAGLQSGCCLAVTRRISLSVINERGQPRKVTADVGESLHDFRQRLNLPEEAFELWMDGVILPDGERSLMELKIDATSILTAKPRTRVVHLKLGKADSTCLGEVWKTTSFRAFLQKASDALKTPLPRSTRFLCPCGRVFSDESAQRSEFPYRCCGAPELHLTVVQPPKNRQNQTAWRQEEVSCQVEKETRDLEAQTDLSQHRATVEATRPVHRAIVEATSPVHRAIVESTRPVHRAIVEATTQIPEGPFSIAKFFILWRFDGSREYFDLDVPFRGVLRGRELRTAIAEARGEAAENWELHQLRAKRRRGGGILVDVGRSGLEFADEWGEVVPPEEWEAAEWHSIDDEEAVRTAGTLRAAIFVRRK